MNIISRMFCYPVMEQGLLDRIADRDAEIVNLRVRVGDLEDRLFMVRGVPPKGAEVPTGKAAYIPTYRTGRQRLKDMVSRPVVATLTAEEEEQIKNSLTQ